MKIKNRLTPIAPEDIPSLIAIYAQELNTAKTIDAITTLENCKEYLEDVNGPKHYKLNILVLDNEWLSDGLFLLSVSNFILTFNN